VPVVSAHFRIVYGGDGSVLLCTAELRSLCTSGFVDDVMFARLRTTATGIGDAKNGYALQTNS